jgi:hypothetical protein
MAADIQAYWRDNLNQVEGWVDRRLLDYLVLLGEIQRSWGLMGNIAEIGVFNGAFFLALAHLAVPDEKCVAIDVFEEQKYNIDGSSPGAPKSFDANWQQYGPADVSLVTIRADSLALTIADRVDICRQHGPFRLFSVDGGHTVDHVVNDLTFAQDTLAPGGVIAADDYFNPHWPGVTEGVQKFLARSTSKVKPFLFIGNKLFLCSVSVHAQYLRIFVDRMGALPLHKTVRILGWDTLAVMTTAGVLG